MKNIIKLVSWAVQRVHRSVQTKPAPLRLSHRLIWLGLGSLLCGPALAANWYVSPSGSDSNPGTAAKPLKLIQTALQNANLGDTIYLEAGTYSGAGDVDLTVNQAVTIASVSGAASTVIDCLGSSSHNHDAISFSSAGTSTAPCVIQNITFKDGYANTGGAFNIVGSVLTISGCVFTNNYANSSGAVNEDSQSSVNLSNSTFTYNTGNSEYGAYGNFGVLTAANCTFTGNSASYTSALYNNGAVRLTGCTFQSNQVYQSGTIECDSAGSLELTSCVISGNSASSGTSGLYVDYGQLTVQNCEFLQNKAPSNPGGAIYLYETQNALIENCVFANNSASEAGGLYADGSVNVVGCTFTGNSASSSSGGGAVFIDGNGSATFVDDILWADSAPSLTSSDEIRNVGSLSITYSDIDYGFSGKGNLRANPLFLSSSNYHIQSTSPCLYTGTPVSGLTTDYAGRIRHNPTSMGAYEGGSLWSVVASAIGPNQNKRVLWTSIEGEAWLWTITPANATTKYTYGPAAGYTPVALAVGPDNDAYLTWQLASGEIEVWNIAANGSHTSKTFNPGTAWSFVSLSVGTDSYLHISWQNKEGQMAIWNVSPAGVMSNQEYGPF